MSIAIKTIGNKRYAYHAFRIGNRVVQKYLGSIENPQVQKILMDRENSLPDFLKTLFWDTDPQKVELNKNSKYVIEKVLEYGDIRAFAWLQERYTAKKILDVLELSRGVSEKSKNFWIIWFKGASYAY